MRAELGLPELDDLADIMRLSGEDGAAVYQMLRARAASMRAATTNADGLYVFNGLAPGQVTVTAKASGFRTTTITRTVAAGAETWGSVGLQRAIATDLVAQTMAGSAAMLLERIDDERTAGTDTGLDTTPARLRAMVTSPAGTTAAGLRELERGAVRAAVTAAVDAAKTRSEQLGITSE